MKLSIIIPVYNGEKYLKQCLDLVAAYPSSDMECLLVNDGSVDSSQEICESYVEKDQRFKLVNKENEGVSAARNEAIDKASGEYVMFLDADDYLTSNSWGKIILAMYSSPYDFIGFSYYTAYEDGKIVGESYPFDGEYYDDFEGIKGYMFASSRLNTCWGKLFLLDKIKKYGLRFREELKIGEDFVFVADYFKRCQSAVLYNAPILYYRQHRDSAMRGYDFKNRLNYVDILYDYSKASVLEYKDSKLLKKMYQYYFKIITNLFLEFSIKREIRGLVKDFEMALNRDIIKEIIATVKLSEFPFYKKAEGRLFKSKRVVLLSMYFKMKALFR